MVLVDSSPPIMPLPERSVRDAPSASNSSMKMMQGAALRAMENRLRTREAPTPTNISTNSDPAHEKNGTFASPAIAFASSVLPVPGGPTWGSGGGQDGVRRGSGEGCNRRLLASSVLPVPGGPT
eukprot:511355-Pyramimonas_sp.AAC.1